MEAYLKETGDWSILDEMVAFDCDMSVGQPLMEHLRRSFNYTREHLAPNGLPLIGRAFAEICHRLGLADKAADALKSVEQIAARISSA